MSETKERIWSNWKTTIIGIPLLLFACFMVFSKIMYSIGEFDNDGFSIYEIIMTFTIGWAFLNAKDSLLGGMFGIVTKLLFKK